MEFITLSEQEIKNTRIYNSIRDKHIVISITGGDSQETSIPPNLGRVAELHLKFDDISDIDDSFLYFNRAQAEEIIDFLDKFCNQISTVVVQCHAGLSRSVGVAAALSKIINNYDDNIFTKGIPNMFVYTTILDTFFGCPYWQKQWSRINFKRLQAMGQTLTPATVRLYSAKEAKRYNK